MNEGKIEFIFNIDDLSKSIQEGGFEIKGFQGFDKRLHLVKRLKKIQDEDSHMDVKGGKSVLLEKGIERCSQLYPIMPKIDDLSTC